MSERIGEVIEASTTEFVAQSYELHQPPPFGSFVRVTDAAIEIYGLVANTKTGSIDPGRRPIARGKDEVDEEDVYRHNPELPELLRTDFTVVIVGFRENGVIYQYLPPRPPRIHGFVYACSPAEVRMFTTELTFLHTLISSVAHVAVDELIAACLRQASTARGNDRSFLINAGKELAILLMNDINRLNAVLRRIKV
ncbi:MAG: hypothetical protein M1136_02165 [Chloroflexi bacterium]|nr:hypothetical protein [Chloroflexota bacterium]MCL5074443.1 hypothetical protein [Chloroflexota bacterium]